MLDSHYPYLVLPREKQEQLEALLFEFDQSWQTGLFEKFVERIQDDAIREAALFGLTGIDLEHHWNNGVEKKIDHYIERFPELSMTELLNAEAIHLEVLAREESPSPMSEDELKNRFPNQADRVLQLMQKSQDSHQIAAKSTFLQADIETSRIDVSDASASSCSSKKETLPKQFGRYEIMRRLGAGAMGTVYLAHDTELNRPVALKIPKLDGSPQTTSLIDRFYREARAAATLQHRNICPVYDVGLIEKKHYITMAYLEGRTMAEYLKDEKPIDPVFAATIIKQLARALAVAHANGVVHRDLKPANIMIDEHQEPVVMDFGLARRDEGDQSSHLTQSGMILGTPAYMSPEQIEAIQDEIGPASDQYGLGVVFYQLLTGKLPFSGSATALIGKILTEEPVPPSKLNKNLNPELESICLKMMAKDAEKRYSSMNELADRLSDWIQRNKTTVKNETDFSTTFIANSLSDQTGKEASATPITDTSRKKPSGSAKWIAGGLILPLLVLAAVIIIKFKDGTSVEIPNDQEVQIEADSDGNLNKITIVSRDDRTEKVIRNTKKAARPSHPVESVIDKKNQHQIELSELKADKNTLVIDAGAAMVQMTLAPDGRHFAATGADTIGDITIWDSQTGKKIKRFSVADDRIADLKYSHDGRCLLFTTHQKVRVVDSTNGTLLNEVEFPSLPQLVVFPEHSRAAVLYIDIPKKPEGKTLTPQAVRLKKRSDQTKYPQYVQIWDWKTGETLCRHELKIPYSYNLGKYPAISPDEKFFTLANRHRYFRYSLKKNEQGLTLENQVAFEASGLTRGRLVFSQNGQYACSILKHIDSLFKLLDVNSGVELQRFNLGSASKKYGCRIAFAPDGKRIVSSDYEGVIRVWDLKTGKILHQLHSHVVSKADRSDIPGVLITLEGRVMGGGGTADRQIIIRPLPESKGDLPVHSSQN